MEEDDLNGLHNHAGRTFDVFFYGLYMDADVLMAKGVIPREPRLAFVDDRTVKLGAKAMLLRKAGARAYGMLFRLTHGEMDKLYADALDYRCEAVSVTLVNRDPSAKTVAAVTMVHLEPPVHSARDPDYGARWMNLVMRLSILNNAASATEPVGESCGTV